MSLAQLAAMAAAVTGVFGAWEAGRWLETARSHGALGRLTGAVALEGTGTGAERRRLTLVVALTLGAVGLLISGLPLAFAAAAAAPLAVRWAVRRRRDRYRNAVAAGMPMAARALADALTGGHTLTAAFGQAAAGTHGPAGDELARAARRTALGVPVDDVVSAMRTRAADPGWQALATSMLLQRDLGGDLAALLRTLAGAAEDGTRAEALARAAMAQARVTAQLIAALPLLALLTIAVLDPATIAAMLSSAPSLMLLIGALILGGASGLMLARLARSVEAP